MKIFGYSGKDDNKLLNMEEVTVQANMTTLRLLATFFSECADEMEADVDWEHAHFQEFLDSSNQDSVAVDLIVFKDG